jgi:Ser-tRNA(Ala) deacylase AlaX
LVSTHSTGTLGASRVVETASRDDRIVHVVAPGLPATAVGTTLPGVVDAGRRRDYVIRRRRAEGLRSMLKCIFSPDGF